MYSVVATLLILGKSFSLASFLTFLATGISPSPLYRVTGLGMTTVFFYYTVVTTYFLCVGLSSK